MHNIGLKELGQSPAHHGYGLLKCELSSDYFQAISDSQDSGFHSSLNFR